jgi:UDP-N-acetylmuramoylalanine--D-glutamate ligase
VKPAIDLQGKRVLVVGIARAGVAASLVSLAHGASVTATDEKPEAQLGERASRLRGAGVKLELGGHPSALFLEQDLIVVSPGVPAHLPALELARVRGIPVWSEIELAWRLLRGTVVAITGSNGKTTTTSLVAHILKRAGIRTLVGGNIGVPLPSLVESSTDRTVTVAEISSFQLETISDFRPEIGVLLNLTPDHLDRHRSFEDYVRVKMRIFENQLEPDAAVLNADDLELTARRPSRPRLFWFSRQRRVAQGAFACGDQLMVRIDGSEFPIARRDEIPLRGNHNVENVLAASAASYLAGADPAAIASGVKSFEGVEHRLEFVADISGVKFYNDSKATNVDAALKAIEAFPGPLVVILGGRDKGSPYTVLREPLSRLARLVILIGSAAGRIASDLGDAVPVEHAGTLERALRVSLERAKPGDVVLLSPACSSFDQFENYEHRGRAFKELVRTLASQLRSGSGRERAEGRNGAA